MGQTAIGAGTHIEQMDAAIKQKLLEILGGGTASCPVKRIVLEKTITEQPMAFKHAPGEQRPHVEGSHPGPLEDVLGKVESQLGACESLRLLNKAELNSINGHKLLSIPTTSEYPGLANEENSTVNRV